LRGVAKVQRDHSAGVKVGGLGGQAEVNIDGVEFP
jgi:hypothetical protein